MQATNSNITSAQALNTYIQCDGLIPLITERLKIDERTLAILLKPHINDIQDHIKLKAVMMTWQTTMLAMNTLQGTLSSLTPSELALTTTRLLANLNELTDTHHSTQDINVNQIMWDKLTPQQKEALLYLENNTKQLSPYNTPTAGEVYDVSTEHQHTSNTQDQDTGDPERAFMQPINQD